MKLLHKSSIIGDNMHRHGWPYVVNHIKKLDTGAGIVYDDFIEQTFVFNAKIPQVLQQDKWVAMVHVPPHALPPFSHLGFVDYRNCTHGSNKALDNLVGVCTMSHHMAERLRRVCDIPVDVIYYPTNLNVGQWKMDRYLLYPQLVHIGWYYKNLLLLEHLLPNPHIKQKIYVRSLGLPESHDKRVKNHCQRLYPNRTLHNDVQYIQPIMRHADAEYDALLERSIIAVEFIDCAATTVLVESLARCAPILVNRHPALVEYLGSDYPMFFDDVCKCGDLLHPDNVVATHAYIQNMDTDFLHIENFITQFQNWIAKYE